MSSYDKIQYAMWLLPVAFVVLTFLINRFEYRKNKNLKWGRAVVLSGFIFYLVVLYFLVIFPLSSQDQLQQIYYANSPKANLDFFRMFEAFYFGNPIFHGGNVLQMVFHVTFYEPLFNIVMTIPFGVFLRGYFKFSVLKTIFFGLLLSLFFETSQLTGLWGIFDHSYRLFDVDDIFNNVLGVTIGALIFPLVDKILSKRV
ncbi:MAG: VanZ family protein [Lactobacillaceae bacterium]|jgi:glycopeptide antibiotics resistance protein|nr:VanZ family protein [Lactobacillaceae bacterium]